MRGDEEPELREVISITKALERTVDDLCAWRPASMTLLTRRKEASAYRGSGSAGRVGP
jgi:hypothetical protein